MKYVVTGGAGFIGSHLVDRLVREQRAEIVVIDNMARGNTQVAARQKAARAVQFYEADIRDRDTLNELCAGADTIFHLAAQSNVMGAVSDTDYSFTTNVVGTYNVLQVAREQLVRRVVFTSSREVYGEPESLPVAETHPFESKNAYGASKAAGELYCRVFQGNFGVDTAIVRLANVYGTRDSGRVIPLWLGWAHEGRDLVVYGGQQVIDFVYVDQVVEALLRATTADMIGRPVNIGSGTGMPILDLAQRILELSASPAKLDLQPARSVEVARFTADVTRMGEILQLEPPADPLYALPKLVEAWKNATWNE